MEDAVIKGCRNRRQDSTGLWRMESKEEYLTEELISKGKLLDDLDNEITLL